jgi:hypothetical protein
MYGKTVNKFVEKVYMPYCPVWHKKLYPIKSLSTYKNSLQFANQLTRPLSFNCSMAQL